MAHRKRGLLLVNLGTPDAPKPPAVRRYLREFLSDPRVVDLPAVPRWLLLHLIILPTRPARSARAYRQIWLKEGSPLLVHSRALARAVADAVGTELEVELGMRYGNPSIASAVAALRGKGVTELVVLPLYPQYAASTVASTQDEVMRVIARSWDTLPVSFVPPFYDDEGFLGAVEAVAKETLGGDRPDHVLFSFHGVPERHIRKSDCGAGHCLSSVTCCAAIGPVNHRCYRAQSFATARLLAERLLLPEGAWSVSFQSRLGRTRWIEPHTDATVVALAQKGVKRLAVVMPSFVADCLETLEEVAIRARAAFLGAGGEAFVFVPSLNAHPRWVETVMALARRTASRA
ncbi:MAG: ferrochelatase [Myxococcaceae bacterium]|nr:ferrochelatase [Myxococcaceae bacterium]